MLSLGLTVRTSHVEHSQAWVLQIYGRKHNLALEARLNPGVLLRKSLYLALSRAEEVLRILFASHVLLIEMR